MQREINSKVRRLDTPRQRSSRAGEGDACHYEQRDSAARSSSRHRSRGRSSSRRRSRERRSSRHRSRQRSRTRSRSRLQNRSKNRSYDHHLSEREQDLKYQRERIKVLESQLRETRCREQQGDGQNKKDKEPHRQQTLSLDQDASRLSKRKSTDDNQTEGNHSKINDRSVSPQFTTDDIVKLIKSLTPQPTMAVAQNTRNNDSRNILPDFNPSMKNQRIDMWLKKVNECATVYGWDDKTTVHFAMQKLQGLAKTWYESLNSILFNWDEWQNKLISAFPYEQNYGQSLEDMLRRKSRYHEPIEVYFYEKLALLNQCDIDGKRAVDCIIHGISDRTIKSSALALRCTHPDQLLQFLMSYKDIPVVSDRFAQNKPKFGVEARHFTLHKNSNREVGYQTMTCFNCKETGHPYFRCPKPVIKCSQCHKVGHLNCKAVDRPNTNSVPKTMCISTSAISEKYYKNVYVNDLEVKAFIDFGSDVTVVTESLLTKLGLKHDGVPLPMKGFGNELVLSIGSLNIELVVDGVCASVSCRVVADRYLELPLLIGQTFTEQRHILVQKSATKLEFFDISGEMPILDTDITDNRLIKVVIKGDVKLSGKASIRTVTDPDCDGYILVDSKVIGRPTEQVLVNGGVYRCVKGVVNIIVSPIANSSLLQKDTVIGRATKVQVVNRISAPWEKVSSLDNDKIDIDQLRVGKSVNGTDKQRLVDILSKYKHCFASTLDELGCTKVAKMNIEVNNKNPIVYRPYRLAHTEREKVRDMINDMLKADIIRESVSEYASPIILVRKKDGKLRLCVDYRMLNSVTVKERYPMPIIEDEIARLSGQACFVTLDLASGYYQIPISEQSKALTSFVTPDGQYEFNRMPFGLANAPAVFQRMMNKVLGSARFTKATAYMDDVLIYGANVNECLEKLEQILQLLEAANLTLNLAKCVFLNDTIDYLGYEISAEGIRPGDKKILSVQNFPRPTNQHGVRQFLGLVSYFRKFIQNFAKLSYPLSKLLKKDSPFIWSDEQEEAFNELKEKLIGRPILAIYDPSAETELHTDASKLGIGGMLMQRSNACDSFRPVAFYSRQTSPEEKNFHSYELETLAVVCSLTKFRVYLLGQEFKVVTDCGALRSTFTKRDLIPRIARWWLLLQEYQCTVEYRPGTKMAHVDALSRNPINDAGTVEPDQYPTVMSISSEDWLLTLQLGDSEIRRIKDILTTDIDAEKLKYIHDNYLLKDNKIYKYIDGDKNDLRWVVPKGARWQLCRMNHDEIGHFGIEKTLNRLRNNYWFPKMAKFVKKYVGACLECAYAKKQSTNSEGHLHPITKVDIPFHTIHVDHLGPFVKSKKGNSYLLVLVDGFTKFVFIKPVRNTKSKSAIVILEDIFDTFRTPDRLISDRGTCFTSNLFKKFCTDRKIKHVLNSVASPQSNGQVERYNRTILSSLTAHNLNNHEKSWDEKIGRIQWGLNNSIQKTTGRKAAEIMFGTSINSEVNPLLNEIIQDTRETIPVTEIRNQVKDRIDEEQVRQKYNYDKGRRPARIYSEGDLVKIARTTFNNDGKSRKLISPFVGPYRVLTVLDNDRYELAPIPGLTSTKNKRKTTIAASRMSPWVHIAALNVNDSNGNSVSDTETLHGSSDTDGD